MFVQESPTTTLGSAVAMAELIYHATVRNIRKSHGNALIGLLMNMLQTIMLVLVFYLMFSILGLRGTAIRGDFLLYIMSGIFLYMTHAKALGAVVGSEGPTSAMMKHAPMNTVVAICAAALGSLYIQILSLAVVLFIYHVGFNPVVIEDPVGAFAMIMLSWFAGVSIGMVFLAVKPWAPDAVRLISTLYNRANMLASGKMFVANSLPGYMLVYFSWNPLFHTIDQARGFTFINYNPHFSSITYPLYLSLTLLVVGLMWEFTTRRSASLSWSAKR